MFEKHIHKDEALLKVYGNINTNISNYPIFIQYMLRKMQ